MLKDDYIHGGTQKDFYEENEREHVNCPLCGGNNYVNLSNERGLTVVKCKSCDLFYVNPKAKDSELNYHGNAEIYYSEARLIFKGKKKHHRDKNYEYELKKIRKIKKHGNLLDIGSNMGFFLRKAQEFGFISEGVEPSPSLSKIAVENFNLKIHNCFLETANLPANRYDVITMIDVFEHVTNPKELLQKCQILLKSDGIVAIKVPNGDYNYFKLKLAKLLNKQNSMDIWNAYEHVCHYTPKTFKKMIDCNGFKIKKQFIPLPIHPPIWANLVGHYYQYPSPKILDLKRIILRNLFYALGKIEFLLFRKSNFAPDLMFIIEKKKV